MQYAHELAACEGGWVCARCCAQGCGADLLGVRLHTAPAPGLPGPALCNQQKQTSCVLLVQSTAECYALTVLNLPVLNRCSRLSLMAHYLRADPLSLSKLILQNIITTALFKKKGGDHIAQ